MECWYRYCLKTIDLESGGTVNCILKLNENKIAFPDKDKIKILMIADYKEQLKYYSLYITQIIK